MQIRCQIEIDHDYRFVRPPIYIVHLIYNSKCDLFLARMSDKGIAACNEVHRNKPTYP